jgi:hypothetical protein
MKSTFDHEGDAMPPGRIKYIYRLGVVSEAVFESVEDSPFTGLYKGAEYCFVRLSSLMKP